MVTLLINEMQYSDAVNACDCHHHDVTRCYQFSYFLNCFLNFPSVLKLSSASLTHGEVIKAV